MADEWLDVAGGSGGGSSFTPRSISSDTTLDPFDLAFVDASSNAVTLTMPAAPSDGDAVQIVATDTSGGNIIFAANSGQSLSGIPNLQAGGEAAEFRYRASDSTWVGVTADVLERFVDLGAGEVTVTTDEITDKADGQPWETLREAGFESGDLVNPYLFGPIAQAQLSTVSSSYTGSGEFIGVETTFNKLFPTDCTTAVTAFGQVSVGAGETVDIRIRDLTQGETAAELTGLTSNQSYKVPVTEYEPPDPDSRSALRLQIRTSPGSNSSNLDVGQLAIGVIL